MSQLESEQIILKEINEYRTTETSLDLIIHNGDLIESTRVLECPFSDHDFVTASLYKLPSTKPCLLTVKSRNLSKLNLDSIKELLNINFEFIKTLSAVEDMWLWLKTKILSIIDSIALIKDFTNLNEINHLIEELLNSSCPGICGITKKVIKAARTVIVPPLTFLFNKSIQLDQIPSDWKTAIVTPVYKSKGEKEDFNNYRGISVLLPFSKLFEKLLSNNQHGFRGDHSCETALHEVLSDINSIRSSREIGLYLFIDLIKAFDTVNSTILPLEKMKFYGFGQKALQLRVIYAQHLSDSENIKLGVPQRSILGPLFFLIFINDLEFYLNEFKCKFFADDTTLSLVDTVFNQLLKRFNQEACILIILYIFPKSRLLSGNHLCICKK
ncbi:unnamed protein product [Brachionus calyciflorus]|uniref:Reverse transcriptase domain-containing protein n=1 Tax=Brachionus calyciflorus TaxID=104777 RepID=A0A813RWA1_9BILA|nr:unnamed protein product [Brachionus calyciflorus]